MSAVNVSFRVQGNELSNYLTQIQAKSDKLTDSAIKSALEQTKASKEQLSVIQQIIAATEKKNKLEAQAARSIALERRDEALKQNRSVFEGRKNDVFANAILTEGQKKERITALTGSESQVDQRIKSEYRENLRSLQEQEKQSKIMVALSKEQIQTAKEAAKEQIKAIKSGDTTLSKVIESVGKTPSEEEKLTLGIMREELEQQKKRGMRENGSGNGILGGLLAVDNINKIITTSGQFAQTNNGFDLIQPASNLAGRVIGGIIGGLVAAIATEGVGIGVGVAAGASIGGGFGDAFGALEQREVMSKEAFKKSAFRYSALTGSNLNSSIMPNMENVGVDFTRFTDTRYQYAKARGYSKDADKTAIDAINLERGFSIPQSVSEMAVETLRSSKESNRSLAGLITGILQKGQGSIFKNGDNTALAEITNKFLSLQNTLLKTQNSVPTALTFDIIKQFNSLGAGMFNARDPRSAGIINTINSDIQNAPGDNIRAMQFGILRNAMPKGTGIFAMREEIQKGIASQYLFRGEMDMVDRLGGDDDTKMNQLSGLFPGVPLAGIRKMYYAHRQGKFKAYDMGELQSSGLSDAVIRGRAENYTTPLEKNSAKIENGILEGQAIEKMADAFKTAVEEAMSGAVVELKDGLGIIRLNNIKPSSIKHNETKKAEIFNKHQMQSNGLNSDGTLNMGSALNKG